MEDNKTNKKIVEKTYARLLALLTRAAQATLDYYVSFAYFD